MNFGGVIETVVTNKEFSLEKAHEVLKNEPLLLSVTVYRVPARLATCATTVST